MKITIIGTGYVGLVTGAGFADLGNEVLCLDIDNKKIINLKKNIIPIYEPGLKELVSLNVSKKRLFFTNSYKDATNFSKIFFLCLPTPQRDNGEANLEYIFDAVNTIIKDAKENSILVVKSTVPVGTNKRIKRLIKSKVKKKIMVVSNPEFLREGAAVKDFKNPDRIVIGTRDKKAGDIISQLYKPLERMDKPILLTSPENSELIKYASNAMLSTRISFMNELSQLCEAVGGNIKEIAKGIGLDKRIGTRFLQAGIGYGGSCFPKDVKALAFSMELRGIKATMLRSVDYVNETQKRRFVPRIHDFMKKIYGKKVAVWGLAFKPKTDDIREAPAINIVEQLLEHDSKVSVFDPKSMANFKKIFGNKILYGKDMYSVLKDADVLIINTEWDEFRNPDFDKMKKLMKKKIIADGRNIYSLDRMKQEGFKYISVGRRTVK